MVHAKKTRTYNTGVRRENILQAAARLTKSHGLDGWTMRDLAAETGSAQSVIYDKVGTKDNVCTAIVGLAFIDATTHVPDTNLEWKAWFRAYLIPWRRAFATYPGAAKWFLRYGPGTEGASSGEILDTAISKLLEAGFGDQSGLVFAMIMSIALTTIGMEDAHTDASGGNPMIDYSSILTTLNEADSKGGNVLAAYVHTVHGDIADTHDQLHAYYVLVLETMLNGLEATLLQ